MKYLVKVKESDFDSFHDLTIIETDYQFKIEDKIIFNGKTWYIHSIGFDVDNDILIVNCRTYVPMSWNN